MASKKQIQANRRNSKKSTGPKTPEGKLQSSMNALTHGQYARDVVLFDEDPAEFERFRLSIHEAYPGADAIDREVLNDLAYSFWRQRRIPLQEAAIISATPEDAMIEVFPKLQLAQRIKVLERLSKLQLARGEDARSDDHFRADLCHALSHVVPEVIAAVLEAEKARDRQKELANVEVRETRLRNGIARILAMLPARRGSRRNEH